MPLRRLAADYRRALRRAKAQAALAVLVHSQRMEGALPEGESLVGLEAARVISGEHAGIKKIRVGAHTGEYSRDQSIGGRSL